MAPPPLSEVMYTNWLNHLRTNVNLLNRQEHFKHWVLAVLDLRTKQFTLLGSLAHKDKGNILGNAEVARLQGYLDHLVERQHNKPIEWQNPLFPGEAPAAVRPTRQA